MAAENKMIDMINFFKLGSLVVNKYAYSSMTMKDNFRLVKKFRFNIPL